jgi:hypothetical protein
MTEHIIPAIIVLLLAERIIAQIMFARERRELYNRLQAGTLTDYVRNEIVRESAKPKPISTERQEIPERRRSDDGTLIAEVAIAESQDAFTRIMGERE